jgi:hypothetical protein
MAKLQCNRCNFKWASKTSNIPKICPYCGKDGCIYDTEETGFKNVDELLTL